MTAPATKPNGASTTYSAPPSPKAQAMTFAISLAEIRSRSEVGGEKATDVNRLISDARAIAAFLGAPPRA